MYIVHRRDQSTNHLKSNISTDHVKVDRGFDISPDPANIPISLYAINYTRFSRSSIPSPHDTCHEPHLKPQHHGFTMELLSVAGTALKRYLIRPRKEPGSTSQFGPLSPFQRPDLKHLRRSTGDPACQRARDHGPQDHGGDRTDIVGLVN